MSFESDIQGQNTQLYPIVVIQKDADSHQHIMDGNSDSPYIFLSTNNTNIDLGVNGIYGNYHCKPILLNVPSIKESVDIESRKFKISNVSLDISNIEYEGKRFSDILSETSLINTSVAIYFKSNSTNWVAPVESPSILPNQLEQVYKGIIRRISHDDTKVSVELEDLTEKNAHKDLPQASSPPSDYLPDKYVNKPIPMVYGHVDRSPLLPYYSYSEDIGDDSDQEGDLLEYRLKVDERQFSDIVEETITMGNAQFTKSGLFVNDGEVYLNIHQTNAQLGSQAGIENFRYENTSVVFDTDLQSYGGEGDTLSNDTVDGILRFHQVREFAQMVWHETSHNQSSFGGTIGGELLTTNTAELGHITGTIDVSLNAGLGVESSSDYVSDYSRGYYKCILRPIRVPNSMAKNEDGSIKAVETYVLLDVSHHNHSHANTTPDGGTENSTNGHGYSSGSGKYTSWAVWVTDNPDSTWVFTGSTGYNNPHIMFTSRNSWNNITGNDSFDGIYLSAFSSLNSFDHISIGIPKHKFSSTGVYPNPSQWGDDQDIIFNVDTDFKESFIVQTFFLDGITDKDYYANVKGRINTDNETFGVLNNINLADEYFLENPIDIIYDLVRSEIGHNAIDEAEYTEAKLQHKLTDGTDWKFGFTVNKKINSKKLIEGIAKSTKCFPKFKNDGTFGFNTIKDSYDVANDYAEATPIKESEVISYSFKKTKPEQIHKRVDVQYKKDYAQDSFLKRTDVLVTGEDTGVIDDSGDNIWKDDYYGIENSKDTYLEFESDYIRDEQTADALGTFLSEQYRNDHLLFNLKLPLQYINLEIGDLVKFEDLFQGLTAYGINYTIPQSPNTQIYYPLFMVTSTKKNLDSVEIECMQLHHLGGEYDVAWNGQIEWGIPENLEVSSGDIVIYHPIPTATASLTSISGEVEVLTVTPPTDFSAFAEIVGESQGITSYRYTLEGEHPLIYTATDIYGNSYSTQITLTVTPQDMTPLTETTLYVYADGEDKIKSELDDLGNPLFDFSFHPQLFGLYKTIKIYDVANPTEEVRFLITSITNQEIGGNATSSSNTNYIQLSGLNPDSEWVFYIDEITGDGDRIPAELAPIKDDYIKDAIDNYTFSVEGDEDMVTVAAKLILGETQ